jgi:hypothetical protein
MALTMNLVLKSRIRRELGRPYFITITNKIAATTIAPKVPTSKNRNLKSFSIHAAYKLKAGSPIPAPHGCMRHDGSSQLSVVRLTRYLIFGVAGHRIGFCSSSATSRVARQDVWLDRLFGPRAGC